MSVQEKKYGRGLVFIGVTFVALCLWLCRQ